MYFIDVSFLVCEVIHNQCADSQKQRLLLSVSLPSLQESKLVVCNPLSALLHRLEANSVCLCSLAVQPATNDMGLPATAGGGWCGGTLP